MPDIKAEIKRLSRARQMAMIGMEKAARAVVPVLLDHNLANSAEQLKVAIFELDAVDDEMKKLIESDPIGVLTAALGGPKDA